MSDSGSAPANRILRMLARVEDTLLVLMLLALVVLSGGQILLRNFFDTGVVDLDSILRLLVLWSAMFGAMVATRQGRQIHIDVWSGRLGPRARPAVRLLIQLFTMGVCALVAWHTGAFVGMEYGSGSTVFASVPTWLAAGIFPLAFGLITFHYGVHVVATGQHLWREVRRP
jgi:TRAP-type C4-dicarboxylate transport system permease small subunit